MALSVLRSFGTKEFYLFGSSTHDSWRLESDIALVDLDHEEPLAAFLRETDRLVRIA
jgi:predicted nucleotidyltransferase